ncbi:hypothetical protein M422DRAFT_256928 [Sphaerobolus stellatus SS14]|uniref:Uncharacterized protein n=1 Tax=Sphaerobolus stellatus (strain SS14) TaxID=990650 RepID=A0A0C9VPM1_SPHS4|nr:hypothetical protein M422DRAFT_256928 [Sphaerobolus stellatus SS14]
MLNIAPTLLSLGTPPSSHLESTSLTPLQTQSSPRALPPDHRSTPRPAFQFQALPSMHKLTDPPNPSMHAAQRTTKLDHTSIPPN